MASLFTHFLVQKVGIILTFQFFLYPIHQEIQQIQQTHHPIHQQGLSGSLPFFTSFFAFTLYHSLSAWMVPPNWSCCFWPYLPALYSSHLSSPSSGFSLNLQWNWTLTSIYKSVFELAFYSLFYLISSFLIFTLYASATDLLALLQIFQELSCLRVFLLSLLSAWNVLLQ